MKNRMILPAMAAAAVFLTGCGSDSNLTTIQGNTVPIIFAETTAPEPTENTSVSWKGSGTMNTTTVCTDQTSAVTETESGKTTASHASDTVRNAVGGNAGGTPARDNANVNITPDPSGNMTVNTNTLLGKWETVSFSKDTGESTRYDLSNPAHRNCYIGLDLREGNRASLNFGTEEHTASYTLIGNVLSLRTEGRGSPIVLDFTVSNDRSNMTVSFLNGRVTATLKRIDREFSIIPFLSSETFPDNSVIIGEWYFQELDQQNNTTENGIFETIGILTVNGDGTYIYQPIDGSLRKRGRVRIETEESMGESSSFFGFYDENNSFWIGTNSTSPNGRGTLAIGNGGTMQLRPKDAFFHDYEQYIGTWQCDRCNIQIGDYGIVQIHWADSASEDNVWEYSCVFSPDNTYMECLGGGTKTHIVTAEDGTETRTEIYNDGTASFRMRGDTLFWSDDKENVGMEMGFKKTDKRLRQKQR